MQRFTPGLLGDGIDTSEHSCHETFSNHTERAIRRSRRPPRRNYYPGQYSICLPQIGYDGGLAPLATAKIVGENEDRASALTSSTLKKVVRSLVDAFPYLGITPKAAI